jgi:hypothetical protein
MRYFNFPLAKAQEHVPSRDTTREELSDISVLSATPALQSRWPALSKTSPQHLYRTWENTKVTSIATMSCWIRFGTLVKEKWSCHMILIPTRCIYQPAMRHRSNLWKCSRESRHNKFDYEHMSFHGLTRGITTPQLRKKAVVWLTERKGTEKSGLGTFQCLCRVSSWARTISSWTRTLSIQYLFSRTQQAGCHMLDILSTASASSASHTICIV